MACWWEVEAERGKLMQRPEPRILSFVFVNDARRVPPLSPKNKRAWMNHDRTTEGPRRLDRWSLANPVQSMLWWPHLHKRFVSLSVKNQYDQDRSCMFSRYANSTLNKSQTTLLTDPPTNSTQWTDCARSAPQIGSFSKPFVFWSAHLAAPHGRRRHFHNSTSLSSSRS